MSRPSGLSAVIAILAIAWGTSQAAVVVDTLPFEGVPEWTDVVFSGTAMVLEDTNPGRPGYESTRIITEQSRGVWFGWSVYAHAFNEPAWSPGSSLQGNYLRLDAQFGPSSTDWSSYFYDDTFVAAITFGPTIGCDAFVANNGGCYGLPRFEGIIVGLARDDDPRQIRDVFVPLDLAQTHTFETLLKNGLVTYHVDGNLVASGPAVRAERGTPLAVIGDGSGPTLTGEGYMRVSRAVWDNAPTFDTLADQARANVGDTTNPAGTTIEVAGALQNATGAAFGNSGTVKVLGTGRFLNMEGATLSGVPGSLISNAGLFQTDAGSQFHNAGTFRNLGGGLAMLGGDLVNVSPNTVDNQGTMQVTGTLTNAVTGVMYNSGLLVIETGGTFVNQGLVNNSGQVTNAGTVELAVGSQWLGTGSFVQSAGLTRVDGLMEGASLRFEGGRVAGTGMLRSGAPMIVAAGAVLGGAAGLPVLDADLTLSGDLEFASTVSPLSMGSHGLSLLAGSEIFVTLSAAPVAGDAFLLVDAGSISGLTLVGLHVSGGGGLGFALEDRAGDLYLTSMTPVPEPAGFALLGAGLALIWWRRRGRAATAAC